MRRLAGFFLAVAVLALLSSRPALAAYRTFTESQALSRAAPTAQSAPYTGETEGVDLAGAVGYRVCVAATSGNTLTGGTIKQYVYSYEDGLWGENPLLAQTVTSTTRKQCWDYKSTVGRGRLLPATSSVTVSGGTTVVVSVVVWYE
jgi:hypothetical protein